MYIHVSSRIGHYWPAATVVRLRTHIIYRMYVYIFACVYVRRLNCYTHSTQQLGTYFINNRELETTLTQRDLGVMVQKGMLWSSHYNKISRKAYMALHLIKRILPPHASTNLKRQLYLSLVRSHLTYCSQLWRPRLIKDIEILERIQRRATNPIKWTTNLGCCPCTYCHSCTG